MQNVVIDRPYEFVPPHRGTLWPRFLQSLLGWRLRRAYGIVRVTCRGTERLQESLAAGHGVLLTPNHCRPCDPEVVHEMCHQAGVLPFLMASWHLFNEGRVQAFLLRTGGTFSIYREGTDRAALATAIGILERGRRPLVIFPEGVVTRANDRLNPLLEGVAFIARKAAAARARAGPGGTVVVHPVALRYRFGGDVRQAVDPILCGIEGRLTWRRQTDVPLETRITKVGRALLTLKEVEYFDAPQVGTVAERVERLIDGLLVPLEREWLGGARKPHVVARVKALRTAVLYDLLHEDLPEPERARRWDQMADMYLAQSIGFYPPDYLDAHPTPERMLETVERLQEDLTDIPPRHEPLHVTVTVGEPIALDPARGRDGDEELLQEIETRLGALLGVSP